MRFTLTFPNLAPNATALDAANMLMACANGLVTGDLKWGITPDTATGHTMILNGIHVGDYEIREK